MNSNLIDVLKSLVNRNDLFRDDKTVLDNVYFDIRSNVLNFQVPTFENGAVELVRKVFDIDDKIQIDMPRLSPLDVLKEDSNEVKVYKRVKKVKISDIDTFNDVNDFIFRKISHKEHNISINEALDLLPKNTSAGFPYYGKKKSKSDISYAIVKFNEWINDDNILSVFKSMIKHPVTIFHRFSPKIKSLHERIAPEFKIRQILGSPFCILLFERVVLNSFVVNFKEGLKPYHTIGLRKTEISDRIGNLRNFAKLNKYVILCGDINGCDKSVSLEHGFSFFKNCLSFIDSKYSKQFIAYGAYFLRTPMLYVDGLTFSHGSTLTGSWITSIFTTYIGMSSTFYAFKRIYGRYPNPDEIQVQGDDFIVVLKKESDKFLFKEYMLELNLRLRLDKSFCVSASGKIEFLGFIWDIYNQPDQTDAWIVGKLLYPERFIKINGPLRIIYRMLSIIINLKRFLLLFRKFEYYDRKLYYELYHNKIKSFMFLSMSNTYMNVKIPINDFIRKGWRLL